MGILGYSADLQTVTSGFPLDKFYYVDLCTHCLYHGVDWIYAFVETVSVYDIKSWYFWSWSNIFQDTYNTYFNSSSYISLFISHFNAFFSVLLDTYLIGLLNKLPYNDEWFRAYLASIDTTSTLYYYPELTNILNNESFVFILPYTTFIRTSIQYLLDSEILITSVMLFPQYLMCLFFIAFFLMLYFNYYTSSTKEENITDHDFLIFNATVDAEEEIGSIDDMLFGFLIFFYIFAWFFYAYFWSNISFLPELLIIIWLFPLVYVIILLIPASLLYDFGIYFLGYLRGVGTTPIFSSEILFDYIAIFAFFIRLVVQGVRLLLMFFVYMSFHDLILYWSWDVRWFYNPESFWQDLYSLDLTLGSVTYFFFLKLPTHIIYFMYELLHTFFVVTAQFFAFVGMVFWLFFFLYTFFTFEPHEAYLSYKRKVAALKKTFYNETK